MANKGKKASSSENMDLVFIARAIGKDGTVIEKEIRLDDALPNVADFDLSTMEGFRRDFDQLERSILDAGGLNIDIICSRSGLLKRPECRGG